MGILSNIVDGSGTRSRAKVLKNGALVVQTADVLQSEKEKIIIFNSFLTDDGTKTGNSDARVNGSVTPVEFYIVPPNQDKDLYISTVFFTIADSGATLNQFGNISALTNGFDFFYQNDLGDNVIRSGLTTNFEIGRMCGFQPAFGSGSTAFRANNVEGNSEGFLFEYDFKKKNGFARGIVLEGGSNQRLALRVNDDVTGVDKFDIYVTGFERIKTV